MSSDRHVITPRAALLAHAQLFCPTNTFYATTALLAPSGGFQPSNNAASWPHRSMARLAEKSAELAAAGLADAELEDAELAAAG